MKRLPWIPIGIAGYVALVLALWRFVGPGDRLSTWINITNLYVLTWTLIVLWRYAELTRELAGTAAKDLNSRIGEWRIAQKPIVFLSSEWPRAAPGTIAERLSTLGARIAARNVGPGLAVNVYILSRHVDGRWDITSLGALEPGGPWELPNHFDRRFEAHAGRLPGRVVVAEAMKTRTIRWMVTFNVQDADGNLRHAFMEGVEEAGDLSSLLKARGADMAAGLAALVESSTISKTTRDV